MLCTSEQIADAILAAGFTKSAESGNLEQLFDNPPREALTGRPMESGNLVPCPKKMQGTLECIQQMLPELGISDPKYLVIKDIIRIALKPISTRPAEIKYPEKKEYIKGSAVTIEGMIKEFKNEEWNSCIDEFRRLNQCDSGTKNT